MVPLPANFRLSNIETDTCAAFDLACYLINSKMSLKNRSPADSPAADWAELAMLPDVPLAGGENVAALRVLPR